MVTAVRKRAGVRQRRGRRCSASLRLRNNGSRIGSNGSESDLTDLTNCPNVRGSKVQHCSVQTCGVRCESWIAFRNRQKQSKHRPGSVRAVTALCRTGSSVREERLGRPAVLYEMVRCVGWRVKCTRPQYSCSQQREQQHLACRCAGCACVTFSLQYASVRPYSTTQHATRGTNQPTQPAQQPQLNSAPSRSAQLSSANTHMSQPAVCGPPTHTPRCASPAPHQR